jgi:hypothetical protein
MNSEIHKHIRKSKFSFDYATDDDGIMYWICYDRESKNIKHLKYLVENSPNLQWWDNEFYMKIPTHKYCITINTKPII